MQKRRGLITANNWDFVGKKKDFEGATCKREKQHLLKFLLTHVLKLQGPSFPMLHV